MRQAAALVVLTIGLCVASVASGSRLDAPPGATALCNDGTYSFSQTRSGTCSHHGGVAQWLTGSGSTSSGASGGSSSGGTSGGVTSPVSGSAVSGSDGASPPLIPINGYLNGFASGQSFSAWTLCFASYGSTLSSGTLDWGDGSTDDVGASASALGHAYSYGGSYTITLTCIDSAGWTYKQILPVSITGPAPPAATPTVLSTSTTSAPSTATGVPAGASARCVDGTYSFSRHRAGTCSHHGGVAKWLSGAPSAASSSKNSGSSNTVKPSGVIRAGSTALLAARSKRSGCRLDAEPDRRCSPGAYYSGLTTAVICSAGFHTSSIRNVPDSEKHQVEAEYGLAPGSYGSTLEIDHIVSLELGGSNDIANLFPEKAVLAGGHPGFHVKDRLENRVHALVCEGKITLRAAQREIAGDWEALYLKVYGSAP